MKRKFAILLMAAALAPMLVSAAADARVSMVGMGAPAGQSPSRHGETTIATVNPGGSDVGVFVRCYAPDLTGKYVYAAYFRVDANQQALIGPLDFVDDWRSRVHRRGRVLPTQRVRQMGDCRFHHVQRHPLAQIIFAARAA